MKTMRDAIIHHSGSRGTKTKTRMATNMTVSRKAVPQRGCAGEYRRIASISSGSPRSCAWTVMCSAPWYMNTRRMSDIRPISQMYATNTASLIAPSATLERMSLPNIPSSGRLANRGSRKNSRIANPNDSNSILATAPLLNSSDSTSESGSASGSSRLTLDE